ncbi:MAG: PaaI family thioesterase [Terricaulis sp.]
MTDESNPAESIPETLGQRRVVVMEGGRAEIEYEAGMHMCHSGGVVQGGFITGWIDAAMAHAVISQLGFDTVPMSLEIKITFFAPARPGLIIAEGWIEKSGKTTCFAEGLIKNRAGNVLAKGTSTIRLMPRAKVQSAAEAARG